MEGARGHRDVTGKAQRPSCVHVSERQAGKVRLSVLPCGLAISLRRPPKIHAGSAVRLDWGHSGGRRSSQGSGGAELSLYGAPVGLVFSIDNDLAQGSWLDYGMFLQSLMLAAKGLELNTCAEVSIANYPDEVRSFLGIPQEETIVCGMALGYADADAPVNSCSLPREAVNSFTRFHYDGSRQKKESDKELLYSAGVSAR